MRLFQRSRSAPGLDESSCYARSYGRHLRGHVERVGPPPSAPRPELRWSPPPDGHVTAEQLVRAFEERLERRRSRRTP